jgi:ornithine cyclodeaminase/alanine dehydrogenase-like protein (mu-crystallin family)
VVCLCTDAAEPVVRASWLSPGCHVTSVGIHREVGADLVDTASIFVEWRGAAALPFPAGANEIQGREVTELGDVLAGKRPGRRSDAEITLYKSTGFAMEDAVAAGLVYRRAVEHR